MDEEELFRTALSVYYNAGKQPMNGGTRHNQDENSASVTGLKRNCPIEAIPAIVEVKINPTICEPSMSLMTSRVDVNTTNGAVTASSMAAAMIAAQQASKKKKSQHAAPQRRNSKTTKKDENPIPPISNVVNVECALINAPFEKKVMPFKEKPNIPPILVIPGVLTPPPIPANDARRNFCKIVMNAFHSCDIKKLREVLEQHGCANDEIIELHRYEGIQNPHGRNYTRIEGLENILQLWMALFKSAPDFCFDLFNHKTTFDPDWKVIVSCQFTMVGTRIMDVKISQPVATNGTSADDSSCTSTSTDSHCSTHDISSHNNHYNNSSNSNSSIVTSSTTTSTMKIAEESYFTGKSLVVSNTSAAMSTSNTSVTSTGNQQPSAKIYLDTTTTLKQPCQLRYKGKFSVFLDEFQKISKLEFVYTAMEEEMIGVPVTAVGSAKSAVGSQGVNNLVITPSINRASVLGSFAQK